MRRRYVGPVCFSGLPGSGKTYSLVAEGVRASRAGRCVFVNAGFDFALALDCPHCGGRHEFRSFDEFVAIPRGATVLFDEAPLYFSARRWQEFPDGAFYRLTQIRKHDLRLFYSAIDFDMVDVNLRRLTFAVWQCRSVTARLLFRTLHGVRLGKEEVKPRRREFVFVRASVASLYETLGTVAVPVGGRKRARDSQEWSRPDGEPPVRAAEPPAEDHVDVPAPVVLDSDPADAVVASAGS